MDSETIRTAVIYGSSRQSRFCDRVVAWAAEQIWSRPGFEVALVDPALRVPVDEGPPSPEALQQTLVWADAFVVVTPEYNHSFSGALKSFVDSAFSAWQGKPVGFVSYGGISGGLRAVEQLRLVFAELHAVGVRDTVSFANPWERFDSEGRLTNPEMAEQAMDRLLTRLAWWARALARARREAAYA
ncbi:NAD(P)H-dependent FMN reductase [Natronospira proteinivora]|uniref:NAD(P)H-dependent FMN reductase n=1 Tax=Natronospira proteinivora TaxID=1807133 RepID=A0ABT1G8U0_9GAMM|nr:NAD(P)H-dependent oxidoreductase [Natronospira proteinivora]MCP1727651.1 NAD(P)H-dependent FMN reductase [Natronospira proteinivora]